MGYNKRDGKTNEKGVNYCFVEWAGQNLARIQRRAAS